MAELINREETQDIVYALGKDEFIALQMMAFIFLRHGKYDKAGIILKTLHHLAPQNRDIRLSFAFVLSEFELLQEAEEMLAPLVDNNDMNSSAVDLLNTKLTLVRGRLEFKGDQSLNGQIEKNTKNQ